MIDLPVLLLPGRFGKELSNGCIERRRVLHVRDVARIWDLDSPGSRDPVLENLGDFHTRSELPLRDDD